VSSLLSTQKKLATLPNGTNENARASGPMGKVGKIVADYNIDAALSVLGPGPDSSLGMKTGDDWFLAAVHDGEPLSHNYGSIEGEVF